MTKYELVIFASKTYLFVVLHSSDDKNSTLSVAYAKILGNILTPLLLLNSIFNMWGALLALKSSIFRTWILFITSSATTFVQASILLNLLLISWNRLLFPSLPIYILFLTQHPEGSVLGMARKFCHLKYNTFRVVIIIIISQPIRKEKNIAKESLRRWPESCTHHFLSYTIGQNLMMSSSKRD